MLRKEEIPILNETGFQVPIFPKLLNPDIKIDENLAKTIFPKVAKEWYNDLIEYSKNLKDKNTKKWVDEVFLEKKLKIRKEYGFQKLNTVGWEDRIFTLENGFVHSFSISRNAGGSLYLSKSDMNCKTFVSFDSPAGFIRFAKDKALEFNIRDEIIKLGNDIEGIEAYIYAQHNVDYYPGALFLRNWAILYLNEAVKQVLK
jgi:hypothetical protein